MDLGAEGDLVGNHSDGRSHPLTDSATSPLLPGATTLGAGLQAGSRLGAYTIRSLIGQGGMGAVYLAEQKSPRRNVALKLLRPGMADREFLARFQREAEALARVQHVGIAQIYEAGSARVNDEGPELPFFAMELVEGVTLTEFIRQRALDMDARLEVLAKVCDAVDHAHERGLIHRDLKPSNILVTAQDQPKVLDFGVARIADADVRTTTAVTDAGVIIGTLQYMSPEQIQGRTSQIDRRSDIYALGVIAYEMISERMPLELRGLGIAEAARRVAEEEPPRLSSIRRSLRGDVETIVLKALEKDPERRYPTAGVMGADIRRFLRSEPITARPPTTLYQVSKFVKRNTVLVGGVSATIIALTIGLTLALISYRRAEVQRDFALEQSVLAEQQRAVAQEKRADAEREQARAVAAEARTKELLIEARFDAASQAAQRGDWKLVLETIDAALEDPGTHEIRMRLLRSDAYWNLAMHSEGARELKGLLARPDLGSARAEVLLRYGDMALLQYIIVDPDVDPLAMIEESLRLGLPPAQRAYAEGLLAKDWETAYLNFAEVTKLEPWNMQAHGMCTLAAWFTGRLQEGIERCAAQRRLAPDDPGAPMLEAILYSSMGDFARARQGVAFLRSAFDSRSADQVQFMVDTFELIFRSQGSAQNLDMPRLFRTITEFGPGMTRLTSGTMGTLRAPPRLKHIATSAADLLPLVLSPGGDRTKIFTDAAAKLLASVGPLGEKPRHLLETSGMDPMNDYEEILKTLKRADSSPSIVNLDFSYELQRCTALSGKYNRDRSAENLLALRKGFKRLFSICIRDDIWWGNIPVEQFLTGMRWSEPARLRTWFELTDRPGDMDLLRLRARIEYDAGAYGPCIAAAVDVLKKSPRDKDMKALIARARERLGLVGAGDSAVPADEFLKSMGVDPGA